MKKLPSVSLLITTCDWKGGLEITLLSLLGQKRLPDEVIIADERSDIANKALIDRYISEFGIPFIHVGSSNREIIKTAILNKSFSRSRSEYILLINSGAILHPCFISDYLQLARPLSFVSGCGVLVGKRASKRILSARRWRLSFFSGDIQGRIRTIRLKPLARLFYRPQLDISGLTGSINAYWRQDFVKVNGYDESIKDWAQANYDLAAKLVNNGVALKKLKFAGIRYQLSRGATNRQGAWTEIGQPKEVIDKKIKYSMEGLASLTEKKSEEAFIRSREGRISAAIITYNEEKNIEKCIKSLEGVVDEIVVVDSYSQDQTETICKRYNVTFIKEIFKGHIQQKQFALSQATHKYVLSLDADEYLSAELKSSIRQIKDKLAYQGYSMNRRNFYRGKNINHAGWYPDTRIRLFNKEKARWGGENPHDVVVVDNPDYVLHLKGDLYHDTLNSLEEHQQQTENYAKIAANYKFKHRLHKKTALLKMLFSPPSKFFTMYIMKLGFLDGGFGFRICYEEFKYTYKKYKLLFGLYRHQDKTRP